MTYNQLIIKEIKAIEGYFLRKAYGRQEYALELCDAIVEVASRAIKEIEATTGNVPRCRKFFYLDTLDGKQPSSVDNPNLDEFWRQVRIEADRQRRLK